MSLLLLFAGAKASSGPPPPLPPANVHCAYATEDLSAAYATEDGAAVYAPALCFLPGAGGVGWPDDSWRDPEKRKRVREALDRLLRLQKDNTFGRRWFDRFLAEQRKFVEAESKPVPQIIADEVIETEVPQEAATVIKAPVSRSRPDDILAIFAAANALKRWLDQAEEDDDEEAITLLLW